MKRMVIVYGFLIAVFVIIVTRTYEIMITDGEKYSKAAESQRQIIIKTDNGRGNIFDRNMVKFTSSSKKKCVLIVKSKDAEKDFEICRKVNENSPYELYNELYKNGIAYCDVDWNFSDFVLKDYKNAFLFEDTVRYPQDGTASAVIGYTLDGEGVSGIEYAADKYLKNSDNGTIRLTKDATGNLLYGLSFNHSKNIDGVLLKTTLDKKYSDICQKALDGKKGAVVILSVPEFDLVSMVSSPTFYGGEIKDYLQSEDKPLLNRAISMYDMGSVFKIVVTAAALENKSINQNEIFYCNGVKNVENISFLCKNHGQMEHMSLNDAFIHSCNSVFIDIGRKTSYNNIIDIACAFGLNEKLIFPLSFPQAQGILPDVNNYYLADEANLSIGQGKLLGSAVHVANFSAIIANGGVKNKINILDSLLDFKGKTLVDLKEYGEEIVLTKDVSDTISQMMRNTVKDGTGNLARSDYVSISGKTGSAQTGVIDNGEPMVHAWFTGFFPSEEPKYAMCVFIENGKSGGAEAAPVFKEIAEKIAISEGW